jgi:hypothetical protein
VFQEEDRGLSKRMVGGVEFMALGVVIGLSANANKAGVGRLSGGIWELLVDMDVGADSHAGVNVTPDPGKGWWTARENVGTLRPAPVVVIFADELVGSIGSGADVFGAAPVVLDAECARAAWDSRGVDGWSVVDVGVPVDGGGGGSATGETNGVDAGAPVVESAIGSESATADEDVGTIGLDRCVPDVDLGCAEARQSSRALPFAPAPTDFSTRRAGSLYGMHASRTSANSFSKIISTIRSTPQVQPAIRVPNRSLT